MMCLSDPRVLGWLLFGGHAIHPGTGSHRPCVGSEQVNRIRTNMTVPSLRMGKRDFLRKKGTTIENGYTRLREPAHLVLSE
jgi:hypothetical protein